MDNLDLYNYSNLETGSKSVEEVADLMKAMSAGDQTGRDLNNIDTSGAALKTESLDPSLKVLTNTAQDIVLYKMIPKEKAYNTVEEYNQLKDYGLDGTGIFNTEGETPQFTDSIYTRRSVLIKYSGISGEVTHPYTLVRLGSGVGNALAKEVQNKMQFLVRSINVALPVGNSELVSEEFDGLFKQHYDGIVGSTGTLDDYANSSAVIDTRGKALTDANVEDSVNAVVNDGFGIANTIMGNPQIFNDYVKRFHESKRVNVNNPMDATSGATMGQKVNNIATQFGNIAIKHDIFFDRKVPKAYNASASNAKAPATPTVGATPTAVVTDTATKFTDGAGDYFYGVTAKNRYGESAMLLFDTSAQAVLATQAVNLQFTQTDTAYAAESFVIYRTKVDVADYTTAQFWPIFSVSVQDLANGYDGGSAGLIRDRNRSLPGTYSALVLDFGTEVLALKQLAPMMRMDLARTSPAYRFMVLCYLTPVIYAPKKIAKIINIGSDITTS
jgi:hypothetical protein